MDFLLKKTQNKLHFKKSTTSTLLFTDDQVIISITEDNMQKIVYKSNQIITECDLIIYVENTKLMEFKRRELVGNKIIIDNKII